MTRRTFTLLLVCVALLQPGCLIFPRGGHRCCKPAQPENVSPAPAPR
jgi:hypothetical protein